MAINDVVNRMKLTLAAAVVAAGMSGCRAPNILAAPGQNTSSVGMSTQYAQQSSTPRQSNETDDAYRRRMQEMHNQQAGYSWTSGGFVPNEDRTRYSGVSERDVRRYDDDYRHGSGYRPK